MTGLISVWTWICVTLYTMVCPAFSSKLRIEMGDWHSKGKVDLNYGGHWGAVCALKWGKEEAIVACGALGFNTSSVLPSTAHVYQHRSRLERSVHVIEGCQGNERSLDECGYTGLKYLCGMAQGHFLVGVDCAPEIENLIVHLNTEGGQAAGIVQLLRGNEGERGQICGDTWSQNEATVTCRQLGYLGSQAISLEVNSYLIPGDWSVQLHGLQCDGGETELSQCVHYPWGDRPGDGLDDGCHTAAGVLCNPVLMYDDADNRTLWVRLAGSDDHDRGWVMVSIFGLWRDLVQTKWSGLEATVICRMMGFRWGVTHTEWYGRSKSSRASWQFQGGCNGDETSLFDCDISKWRLDTHNLTDVEFPTSVRCYNDVEPPSRPEITGLTEVLMDSETVTVSCDVQGGASEVTVALQCPGSGRKGDGAVRLKTGRNVTLSTSLLGRHAIYADRPCSCAAVSDLGWQASVSKRPKIIFGPEGVKITLPKKNPMDGESFSVLCEVKSNPPAEITWLLESKPVEGAGETYVRDSETGFPITYSRWYSNADVRLTGKLITCHAKNTLTNETAFDIKLLTIGQEIPKIAHTGLTSSKVFSPISFMSFIQSSLSSSYNRKRAP